MSFEIKTLSPELTGDFLFFFDHMVFTEHPHWSMCYCYSFHFTGKKEEWNKENNRSSVIKLIRENKMRGYLAYSEGKPIGWCNVNDRGNYQRLLKYYDLLDVGNKKIASIVCFVVYPEFRRRGVASQILNQACIDYSLKGYDYIEAYPGKGQLSCEEHYTGPLRLYERFGFRTVTENDQYYTVRRTLLPKR